VGANVEALLIGRTAVHRPLVTVGRSILIAAASAAAAIACTSFATHWRLRCWDFHPETAGVLSS
jgi:hypothetical protein